MTERRNAFMQFFRIMRESHRNSSPFLRRAATFCYICSGACFLSIVFPNLFSRAGDVIIAGLMTLVIAAVLVHQYFESRRFLRRLVRMSGKEMHEMEPEDQEEIQMNWARKVLRDNDE